MISPLFLIVLLYPLGAIVSFITLLILNKHFNWVSIKDIEDPFFGDFIIFVTILSIIFWPVALIILGTIVISNLVVIPLTKKFATYIKKHLPTK